VTRWSAHVSTLFTELPHLERPAAARAAGFKAVESWWPDEGADAWVAEVRRCGLVLTMLNAYCGDIAAGDRGFLNLPERREAVLENLRAAAQLATRVNVLVGRAVASVPRRRQLATVASLLREAVAGTEGVTLVIEPVNDLDTPGYLLPTAAAAAEMIEEIGSDRVRMLYDAYHAARSGRDPIREAPCFVGLIDHVHYADCPGRGAPGTGEIDLLRLVEALEGAGYDGAIGLEYDPRGPTIDSLRALPR
jgi:hydroxypyruvate isomerase